MNRYFLATTAAMPAVDDDYGHHHFIDLCSHGDCGDGHHLICLEDNHVAPHPDWIALPRLIDQRTRLADVLDAALLADIGLTGDETMIEAAAALGDIHPGLGF